MISATVARDSYEAGWNYGAARRGGQVPPPPSSSNNQFWFGFGNRDGEIGNPKLDFAYATGAISVGDEQQAYDQGYGGVQLTILGQKQWWDAGKQDREFGRAASYLLRPSPVFRNPPGYRTPPRYQGGGGGGVIVYPPPADPRGPYQGYPPVVVRRPRRRAGIIVRGPWGEINLSRLAQDLGFPQTVRPGDLLDDDY